MILTTGLGCWVGIRRRARRTSIAWPGAGRSSPTPTAPRRVATPHARVCSADCGRRPPVFMPMPTTGGRRLGLRGRSRCRGISGTPATSHWVPASCFTRTLFSIRKTSAATPIPGRGTIIFRPRLSRCRRRPCRKTGRSTAVESFIGAISIGRRCKSETPKWLMRRLSRGRPSAWPSDTSSRCFCRSGFTGRTCRGTRRKNISTDSRSMKSSCRNT